MARPAPSPTRQHLQADSWPAAVYAIGDVHGCHAELRLLLDHILADADTFDGEKWLVFLGDYVDRGPDSAGVLEALVNKPPPGFRRFVLAGNHEIMMQAFLDAPQKRAPWLDFGGDTTLASYGIDISRFATIGPRHIKEMLDSHIPQDHIDLLKSLPLSLSLPGATFVHAGLRPGVPVIEQSENDVLWIRDAFFDAPPRPDTLVVHGHTPAPESVVAPGRICVDTGAFATGRLTAVRLVKDGPHKFLSGSAQPS